jgi:16S rRNA U1498 N3-methylase RsmE
MDAKRGIFVMARKPTDTVQLKLRFPEKLRRRIEQAAERGKQSMNAEIIERLEQSFHKEDQLERDRKLAQEAADATLSTLAPLMGLIETEEDWLNRWEQRLKDASVVNLLDKMREKLRQERWKDASDLLDKLREKLREEARRQSPGKKEQQTNKPTGTGDE